MVQKGILVTGGAGYIGSHTLRQLGEAGERLVTLDNLSTGCRPAVLYGDLVVGDIGDKKLLIELLRKHQINTVFHFAAFTDVARSYEIPLDYYHNNTSNTRILLESCVESGVRNFIFSSTAAVYGYQAENLVDEDSATHPFTPYGQSKLMAEQMVRDTSAAYGIKHVILRYFNVAGCDPELRTGHAAEHSTQLIKVACQAAMGKRMQIEIFGTDYPTCDGTGVRDYIHVEDLANAHLLALDYLRKGGSSTTLNCGYGRGYSVREVLQTVERLSETPLNVVESPRRPGDLPSMIARAERIRQLFGWKPRFESLDAIVSSSLAWEKIITPCQPMALP
ncbi:UDP-glucose 4-epimerase GalE [Candidatus Endoriftia persephone]|jgi:UDP-glucose 4-epimerase|uniref:UDP-glucose 4-epimerase n=3 Tax=Gammaproteobacteria TaxID=1236 RepID=G2FC39_9GAMM|nr:UDP-glucose 4-epimerase GalE [Candidatus Endoriftia persephone]EGV51596.1 UDP-glucose 4-epimerase [endosymbiont of Riftia pachyptila (vent Ph05)]EGW55613.1 UDP-glucose 4-epimerase [endosymbiont of Tevnia jerichonana (vent Tica)]USF86757.1 UDP-glucose 4-epimerase GalE [Candidatus Endoriftia persephone]